MLSLGGKESLQKCRSYDRSDEKQRKNSPCKIHKTGPRKHKNQSNQNVYQMERHRGHRTFEKTGKHHVYKTSMIKRVCCL